MKWPSPTGRHETKQIHEPGLPRAAEYRKTKPGPLGCRLDETKAWLAYIDNLDVQEIFSRQEGTALVGSVAEWLKLARSRYELWNALGNDQKDELRQLSLQ